MPHAFVYRHPYFAGALGALLIYTSIPLTGGLLQNKNTGLFVDLTPFIPLSLIRRGGNILKDGLAPLLDAPLT